MLTVTVHKHWYNVITVPARLGDNVTLNSTLGQGTVSYYQVRIPEGGLTFMVDVNEGKVLVCGSTTDENPDCRDPSTYSWVCETEGYCDIYVNNSALTKRRRRQAGGGEVMFVSIEGVERNNTVVFETMMGDETISDGKKKIILGIRCNIRTLLYYIVHAYICIII